MFGRIDFSCVLKASCKLFGMRVVMGALLLFCLLVCTKSVHAEECVCTPEGDCFQDGRPVNNCPSSASNFTDDPKPDGEAGKSDYEGAFKSKGFTLTPYLAIVLFDNLTFDALFSYAILDNEDQEAYQLTDENKTSVDEAVSYVGEWRFGLRAGYFWGDFEPSLSGAYLYDNTWNDDSEDRDEIEGGIGLDFYPADHFIFSLAAAHTFFREHIRNTRVMFNLRFEF